MLILERGAYKLIINESKKDKPIEATEILSEHHYHEGILQSGGFVILK